MQERTAGMSTTLLPSSKTGPAAVPKEKSSKQIEIEQIYAEYDPSKLRWDNVDWVTAIFLVVVHAGALAAPFFFSWYGLVAFFVLHWMTGSIGICLGYHRYLSHRSMKLRGPAKFFAMLCGTVSGEGTPFMWAATHRLHHARSDQKGDPHSPNDGSWWSHILWLFLRYTPKHKSRLYERYIPELLDQPMLKFFEKTQGLWLAFVGLSLLAGGYALGGWYGAASMVLWGFCLRMVAMYHGTWCVNSATHMWGYKNYETRDRSRNLWWVALIAYGEGWHNNHHAHPHTARAGHRWWEVDTTWWAIRGLQLIGQAYDVDDRIPEQGEAPDEHEESKLVVT